MLKQTLRCLLENGVDKHDKQLSCEIATVGEYLFESSRLHNHGQN